MSYDASLYAALHRGTDGDLNFYTDCVRGAQHVLELGCGYGRILTEVAREGALITGIDNDADMLALATDASATLDEQTRARITLHLGDMRRFALGERFDRVIVPFNGLYCLLSQAELLDCLRCISQHLTKDGIVVFDAYLIDDFHSHADPIEVNRKARGENDDESFVDTLHWQDRLYDVYEDCEWMREKQRLLVRYRHVPRDGGRTLVGSIAHRYLLSWQVQGLCHDAGLVIDSLCEDFQGTPLSHEAEHMVCTARRA